MTTTELRDRLLPHVERLLRPRLLAIAGTLAGQYGNDVVFDGLTPVPSDEQLAEYVAGEDVQERIGHYLRCGS